MSTNTLTVDQSFVLPTASTEQVVLPFLDLKAQFADIREEVLRAVENVLENQHFILGKEVDKLETEVAQLVGCRLAIGCASGSDALFLSLLALHIGADDEVITTPFTFGATAGAIARLNAKPVFVDIDPDTYNLDVKHLERAITPRTRAIIPVHLFGLPAEMDGIMEVAAHYRLAVVEDAAQAIAAQYGMAGIGSIGTLGCFSFFPSKNLGGAGDGGMITTNDPELADSLRILRVHGCRTKYQYEALGVNSRLDALQAAILRVKLRYLDSWTSARQRNAKRYLDLFQRSSLTDTVLPPTWPDGRKHVFNQFVIRVSRRNELREHLSKRGIATEIYYPSPLHLQPAYAYLGYSLGDFPQAELASQQVLALPIYPELTASQQEAVVDAINNFFNSRNQS